MNSSPIWIQPDIGSPVKRITPDDIAELLRLSRSIESRQIKARKIAVIDWSLVAIVGNRLLPRDPNDDDGDDEEEDSDTEPDDEREPAVMREPDKEEISTNARQRARRP
jgi:hypothetical protein